MFCKLKAVLLQIDNNRKLASTTGDFVTLTHHCALYISVLGVGGEGGG